MDCSIIYYTAYKTGYIQRVLTKKFRTMTSINLRSGYAAVSAGDMKIKFAAALNEADLVIIVGGLRSYGDENVMTALSDYFSVSRLSVDSNKRVLNESGCPPSVAMTPTGFSRSMIFITSSVQRGSKYNLSEQV